MIAAPSYYDYFFCWYAIVLPGNHIRMRTSMRNHIHKLMHADVIYSN